MYTHTISRYEKNCDHDGKIVSIFLAVNVSNGESSTCFEHWLTEEEKDLVLVDEANLKPILERCYTEGELKLENEIATRPMPSIFPLNEKVAEGEPTKKEQLEAMVKVAEIAKKKTAIVAEKLQAIEDAKPKSIPID